MSTLRMPKPELTDESYFDLAAVLERLEHGRAVQFPPFEIVHLPQYGLSVCLNMARDPVQNALRDGRFYEQDTLDMLAGHIKEGAHIIDIGSNIGNHALYFAGPMGAQRVVVIEPNPLALAPLVANVVINRLGDVIDMSALGVGLSDRAEDGYGMKRHDRNLGATKMKPGQGRIAVMAGDDLFGDETPDLIKIDVEGMEMQVLAGLEKTIQRCQPFLLIEVTADHEAAFQAWQSERGYQVKNVERLDAQCCNYLSAPRNVAKE